MVWVKFILWVMENPVQWKYCMGFFIFQKSFVIRKNLKNNHIRRESADWEKWDRKRELWMEWDVLHPGRNVNSVIEGEDSCLRRWLEAGKWKIIGGRGNWPVCADNFGKGRNNLIKKSLTWKREKVWDLWEKTCGENVILYLWGYRVRLQCRWFLLADLQMAGYIKVIDYVWMGSCVWKGWLLI